MQYQLSIVLLLTLIQKRMQQSQLFWNILSQPHHKELDMQKEQSVLSKFYACDFILEDENIRNHLTVSFYVLQDLFQP